MRGGTDWGSTSELSYVMISWRDWGSTSELSYVMISWRDWGSTSELSYVMRGGGTGALPLSYLML